MLTAVTTTTFIFGTGLGALVVAMATRMGVTKAIARAAASARTARDEAAAQSEVISEDAARARALVQEHDSAEIEAEGDDLTSFESELHDREARLNKRSLELETRSEQAADSNRLSESINTESRALRRRIRELTRDRVHRLETIAKTARKELLEQMVGKSVSQSELRAQTHIRQVEQLAEANAAPQARRVLASAVDRYNGIGHLERVHNSIPFEDEQTLRALADPEGAPFEALKEAMNCTVFHDEAHNMLTVRSDDPLAREVGRRVLRQLANKNDSSPATVHSTAKLVQDEIAREVGNTSRKVARSHNMGPIEEEILDLLGRLKFRQSYSQNQLKHAVEVCLLAGLLAAELGQDMADAQRGGLLHDIGKALTHDHEGSHAVLGAAVARRCGEAEHICNAIGAHHGDEEPNSVLAYIVAAADALSGARPGARRETSDNYVDRIRAIQQIASRARGIERVDIMHAGREVRVVVASDERGEVEPAAKGAVHLTDADLPPLAEQIANALESELTFAGQIRVTVIRESRSVAIAR